MLARALSLAAIACACSPFIALLWMSLGEGNAQMRDAVYVFLPDYMLHTLVLAFGAAALAMLIGTYTAWIVTRYHFPGRRVFEWALLLPLALPAYVLAIVYGHLLDVAGPVQASLRALSGAQALTWFPNIRSLPGAILMLGLSLYPYVYLLARDAFARQCRSAFDAAWLHGLPPHRWLWAVALPVARPAVMLGGALVMMEAVADYGVVSLFGLQTFTVGIYRAWYGLDALQDAARLALMLLGCVLLLVALERLSRRHMQRAEPSGDAKSLQRFRVSPRAGVLFCALCALPCLLGFGVPVAQLLFWALADVSLWQDALHWQAAWDGTRIAVMTAGLCVALALLFAYQLRGHAPRWQAVLIRIASAGYAIPGSVIAVALFIPLLMLDKQLAQLIESFSGERAGLLITGSVAAVVLACSIRFVAVAMAGVESGLKQLSPKGDDAARLLGARGLSLFYHLHLPALKPILLAAGFMVFADTLKELPATLLLRPFDVSTLSIRTYELAMDGRLAQSAVPALMMVAIGLLAVTLLIRLQRRQHAPDDARLPSAAIPAKAITL